MKREPEEVRLLREENARMLAVLRSRAKDPSDIPLVGCGDNSCLVVKPNGMATNGRCRCDAPALRRAVTWWKRRAAFLEQTIAEMRDGGGPC